MRVERNRNDQIKGDNDDYDDDDDDYDDDHDDDDDGPSGAIRSAV